MSAPIRFAANPVAKKAQLKSLEGGPGNPPFMLPISLVAEGRGPRSSPLYPKVTWPRLLDGRGPLVFAPQACSRHWIKSKNPKHPAVKREAEEDWGKRR